MLKGMGIESDNRKGHESGTKHPITFSRDKSHIPRILLVTGSRGSGMSHILSSEVEGFFVPPRIVVLNEDRCQDYDTDKCREDCPGMGKGRCIWRSKETEDKSEV